LVGNLLDLLWGGQFLAGIKYYPPTAFNTALLVLPLGAIVSLVAVLVMLRYIPKRVLDEI
jgi:hypothetical protein